MKSKIWLVLLLAFGMALLAGCQSGGPTHDEAEAVIYSVYFREAEVLKMEQCPLIPVLEEQGHTDVWYIKYRYVGSDTKSGMLISATGNEDAPWEAYLLKVNMCLK